MPIESEAYVAREGSGIQLEKVTYEEPGPKELLIDIVAASVCHTDVGSPPPATCCPLL
jgi:Zn-dependent alcohol dehydrogenase